MDGWDDPRMPTFQVCAEEEFGPRPFATCKRIGLTKFNALTDISLLEHSIREDLNQCAMRVMGVLETIESGDRATVGKITRKSLEATNHPEHPDLGTRPLGLRSRDLH